MRRLIILVFSVSILLIACNPIKKEAATENKIQAVIFQYGPGSISPEYHFSSKLVVNSDLTVVYSKEMSMTKAVIEKTGRITAQQFNELIKDIESVDLSQLKPRCLTHPIVGRFVETIIIKTDNREYTFDNKNTYRDYPEAIASLSVKRGQYIPK